MNPLSVYLRMLLSCLRRQGFFYALRRGAVPPKREFEEESMTKKKNAIPENGIYDARTLGVPKMLILGLQRGDLDWRDIVNPKTKKI